MRCFGDRVHWKGSFIFSTYSSTYSKAQLVRECEEVVDHELNGG